MKGGKGAKIYRVRGADVSDRVHDSSLRICAPNPCISHSVGPRNIRRLLHNLVVLEGEGQGGQSGDSILVQESGGTKDIRHHRLCVGMLHCIQMVTFDRRYSDRGSIHILVGAGEQPHRPNETLQKNSTLLS